MSKSKASAPGKIILFGEHAVVYGVPAIAASISDLRVVVESSFDDLNGSIQIFIDGVTSRLCEDGCLKVPREKWAEAAKQFGPFTRPTDLDHTDSLPTDAQIDCLEALLSDCEGIVKKAVMPTVWLALAVCASDARMHDSGLHIHIGLANLPIGAGLGSSAAFCVASVASLLQLTGRIESRPGHSVSDSDRELINHWAFAAETLFHGQPSGLDNTVSCYGGALYFRKQLAARPSLQTDPTTPTPATPTGASTSDTASKGGPLVWSMGELPPLRVMVVNTKVPKETSTLVAGVRYRRDGLPAVFDPIINSIGAISTRFASLVSAVTGHVGTPLPGSAATGPLDLSSVDNHTRVDSVIERREEGFMVAMCELMRVNQCLLGALGVSHPALEQVVWHAREHGFYAKLTGAGGGGCAVVLLQDPSDSVPEQVGGGTPSVDPDLEVRVEKLRSECEAMGFDCFETQLGGTGVECSWDEA